MRMPSYVAVAVLGALLAGCAPRYQTFTSYAPPQDQDGRQCLAACSSTRQTCRQSGQPLLQQCRNQAQTEAHLETVRRAATYSIELERHGGGPGAPELPGPASPNYAGATARRPGSSTSARPTTTSATRTAAAR